MTGRHAAPLDDERDTTLPDSPGTHRLAPELSPVFEVSPGTTVTAASASGSPEGALPSRRSRRRPTRLVENGLVGDGHELE